MVTSLSETRHSSTRSWGALVAMSGLVPLFGVTMEWLFFATKPSFLTPLGLGERLVVLLASIALPVGVGLAFGATAALVARWKPADRVARMVVIAVLAIAAAVIAFLLVDNFTLTVLGFGVRDAGVGRRIAYGALFIVLAAAFFRTFRKPGIVDPAAGVAAAFTAAIVFAGLLLGVVNARRVTIESVGAGGDRPNVIILGSDGVNARYTSLSTYKRDTTPFLRKLAGESLVAENAFPNAAHTGGSLVSILSGRLPSTTGVIYPPDILRGADAYRHLPAMLKSRGYKTLQLSVRHYGDAYDLNMQRGFDEVNGRRRRSGGARRLARLIGDDAAYLLGSTRERIIERARHIAGIEAIENVYAEVTYSPGGAAKDATTLERLREFIAGTKAPFFAQVHLMGTHGPKFSPSVARFSAGQEQTEPWMQDFYDDAISDFDRAVAGVVETLRTSGKLENTILVIYSDHGEKYDTALRVPLLIRFPEAAHRGRVKSDVQNIDIAPTILDAMGIEIPEWMEGKSMLHPVDECRPVFSFATDRGEKATATAGARGRLGSVGVATIVACDAAYIADVVRNSIVAIPIRRDPDDKCECGALDKPAAAKLLVEHLRSRGMPVTKEAAARLSEEGYVTRAELARQFVLARHGQNFVPPPSPTSRFKDITPGSPIHPWVEQFAADRLTGGCAPDYFCPGARVTRAQLAVVIASLRGWKPIRAEASALADIRDAGVAGSFMQRAVDEDLLAPCGDGKFCPGDPVTREQFRAVLLRLSGKGDDS